MLGRISLVVKRTRLFPWVRCILSVYPCVITSCVYVCISGNFLCVRVLCVFDFVMFAFSACAYVSIVCVCERVCVFVFIIFSFFYICVCLNLCLCVYACALAYMYIEKTI